MAALSSSYISQVGKERKSFKNSLFIIYSLYHIPKHNGVFFFDITVTPTIYCNISIIVLVPVFIYCNCFFLSLNFISFYTNLQTVTAKKT